MSRCGVAGAAEDGLPPHLVLALSKQIFILIHHRHSFLCLPYATTIMATTKVRMQGCLVPVGMCADYGLRSLSMDRIQ